MGTCVLNTAIASAEEELSRTPPKRQKKKIFRATENLILCRLPGGTLPPFLISTLERHPLEEEWEEMDGHEVLQFSWIN